MLGLEAQIEWRRIAPELHALGLLTVIDMFPLAAYCEAYGRWARATRILAMAAAGDPINGGLLVDNGRGRQVEGPLLHIAERAAADMMKYAAQFGFTPASRTRVAGPAAERPKSKFEGLLAG
jgi:P27 family predicted phage terminase small subunit